MVNSDLTRVYVPAENAKEDSLCEGDPLAGRLLHEAYRLERKIGQGGMGVVYRATQIALNRPVAIKLIHPDQALPPQRVERFFREARLLSQLQHPNIVQIIDFGTDPGPLYFMVMEYLQGETLETFVRSGLLTEVEVLVEFIDQIGAAIAAAHQAQVIHRDLKPSNVFLANVGGFQPLVKVLDFGLGKTLAGEVCLESGRGLTAEGTVLGTCGFSAPEQMQGSVADERSDLYSLGALLYYMVSGRPPYQDEGFLSTLLKQLTLPPEPLTSDWLDAQQLMAVEDIIHRAMSIRPEDRHASPGDLVRELTEVLMPHASMSLKSSGRHRAVHLSDLTPLPKPPSSFRSPVPQVPSSPLPAPPTSGLKRQSPVPASPVASPLSQVPIKPPAAIAPASPVATETPIVEPVKPDHKPGTSTARHALGIGAVVMIVCCTLINLLYRPNREANAGATAYGVSKHLIRFGFSGPLSGVHADLGNAVKIGIETCFQEINELGGIYGRRLQLISLDDNNDPEKARENATALLDQHEVFAFVGHVGTATTEVSLPIAQAKRRVVFGCISGGRHLRNNPPDRYVFNYRPGIREEVAALVRYLVEVRGIPANKIAVFTSNDSIGDADFQEVVRVLRGYGRQTEQILRVGCDPDKTDAQPAVARLLEHKERVGAVLLVCEQLLAVNFLREAYQAKLQATLAAVSLVHMPSLLHKLHEKPGPSGAGLIVSQVVPSPLSNASGAMQYRDRLNQYFPGRQPCYFSLEGYIIARILAAGLHNAGPTLTSETLVDGLERIRDLDLAIGAPISFGPSNHQGSTKVWGTIVDEKGAIRNIELE